MASENCILGLATTHPNPNTAAILFVRRLEVLSRLRALNPTGLTRCAFSKLCRGSSLNSVAVQGH
jgi:hypothetical protein